MNNLDKITLDRIQLLHPSLREEALEMYEEQCAALTNPRVRLRYAYTLRSFKEQDDIFAQGRTKPGKIVTKAKAGQSFHNYGLAYDIVLLIDKNGDGIFEEASWDTKKDFDKDGVADWMEVVEVARRYGWTWGGDWNNNYRSDDERFLDFPHFEKPMGYTTPLLLKKFNEKRFLPNTNYVVI